jgi:4-amino-4-deoxy-L-arabinose transferase-like glycosyltransferase
MLFALCFVDLFPMGEPTMPFFRPQSLEALGLLTILAIVMRIFSFFPAVIDHDESTYIVIADALLNGDVYFRDVIDTKPIGIFGLYAIFMALFGKSIVILRLITALGIALTAWMIYLVHGQFAGHDKDKPFNPAPLASGAIYVFMTSIFIFFGLSPNTELYFALFTITALFLLLRHEGLAWILLAGLLLGLGFLIKYVVLFDALALGLFYLWQQLMNGQKWTFWFTRCVVMAIGFVIPFSLLWMYYAHLGLTETFRFFTFELSGKYFIDSSWDTNLIFILDCLGRYFPVTFWFVYSAWHWRTTGRELPILAWLWGTLVIVTILIPGKLFYHYFIQMILPLSLLAGSFFDHRRSPKPALAWMRNPKIGYPLLITGMVVILFFQKRDFIDRRDYPKEVAVWLNERLQPGEKIYTGNYQQIIYHLTDTKSPTPYIHSSLIWDAENNRALGIDRAEECRKILDHKPRFILLNKKLPKDNPMLPVLETEYKLLDLFDQQLLLYERK